jgi:hypothetical protein
VSESALVAMKDCQQQYDADQSVAEVHSY